MRILWILSLVLMAGCTTPSPEYLWASAPHKTIEVGGNTFKVYYLKDSAQAFRLNSFAKQKVDVLQAQALSAIEMVTGCKIDLRTVKGDAARTDTRIKC